MHNLVSPSTAANRCIATGHINVAPESPQIYLTGTALASQLRDIAKQLAEATYLSKDIINLGACRKLENELQVMALAASHFVQSDQLPKVSQDVFSIPGASTLVTHTSFVVWTNLLRRRVPMPAGAARLLLNFALRPGRLCDFAQIRQSIGLSQTSAKVMVSHCRAALRRASLDVQIINQHGRGYKLREEDGTRFWSWLNNSILPLNAPPP